jgi:hypothetical protein
MRFFSIGISSPQGYNLGPRSQAARHEAAGELVRVCTVQNVVEAVSSRCAGAERST